MSVGIFSISYFQTMKSTLNGSSFSTTVVSRINLLMEVTFSKRKKEGALLYTVIPNYLLVEETETFSLHIFPHNCIILAFDNEIEKLFGLMAELCLI